PRSGGTENDGAEHLRVQVAHDLLEREEDCRDWRVERGGEGCGATGGHERLHLLRTESQIARDHRGQPRAHLHGRSFAPERNAAGERGRAAEELPQHGSQVDASIVDEEREFGLGNAAAARVRKITPEEIARGERSERRDEDAPPAQSSWWI